METPEPFENYDEALRMIMGREAAAALDVLRRKLGVTDFPRYSVLRVCTPEDDLGEILGLLHYGIRVFLISAARVETGFEPDDLAAFEGSRLLEWAVVPELKCEGCWIVDGQIPSPIPCPLDEALSQADASGGINIEQYCIVHAPADQGVLVTAGAGTGKTETMAERLVFLLSTALLTDNNDSRFLYDLGLDEVALITFTGESAREMRRRIALTLSLRQRLSRRCVHPVVAWLMQLSHARISTIHTFAKSILQEHGAMIGLAPDFTVSSQTLKFRELLHDQLTAHAQPLMTGPSRDEIPAAYHWRKHIETLWDALENNGIPLFSLVIAHIPRDLIWLQSRRVGVPQAVEIASRNIIEGLAQSFGQECLVRQKVPTGQLIPSALASLRAKSTPPKRRLRYLFVDEFQDTDGLQMDLMLEVQVRLNAKLFVVGDAKQGIYRFRGAEGNAFDVLERRVRDRGLPALQQFPLTRNFRTGELLLNSLHPYFQQWGRQGKLPYLLTDQLRTDVKKTGEGQAIQSRTVETNEEAWVDAATDLVAQWRERDRNCSIAVLCRLNGHAMKVQSRIREHGGSCELLVGGNFYRTPAVRELRVLLEAIANPGDDAALLELCQSRWAGALLGDTMKPDGAEDPDGVWRGEIEPLLSWRDRLAQVAQDDSFAREDLAPVRARVRMLVGMLARMSALSCIVECQRILAPASCSTAQDDDPTERRRYARCLNHLITLMDAHFAESPATLQAILAWLEIQIATNYSEDEPMDADELIGKTTALTVHKSKGLEFDYVVVPNTWTNFAPPRRVSTRTAVLQTPAGKQILWKWSGGSGAMPDRFTNVDDEARWDDDATETTREETRLLYVAMTRARSELVMLRPRRTMADTWAELLSIGEAYHGGR